MLIQVIVWGSIAAILALAAVVFREARLLRGLYKHPKGETKE